jgi:hypothetical protein
MPCRARWQARQAAAAEAAAEADAREQEELALMADV